MIEVTVAAFGMGLTASVHCFAMCGPLAAAGACRGGRVDVGAALSYFGARLLGYATVGAILGHLGKHALCILPAGTIASIAAACVAAFALARGISILRAPSPSATVAIALRPRHRDRSVVSAIATFLPKRGAALGAATAILPCGVLLPAWILAASTASASAGAATMAAFATASATGLVLPLAGQRLASRFSAQFPRRAVHGLGWLVLGTWMAVRPFLTAAHVCH